MLKKYLPFFFIFLGISIIPGAIFFIFPNAASNINSGDIPSVAPLSPKQSTAQWEQQSDAILAHLTASHAPLTVGHETFQLDLVDRATGSPPEEKPKISFETSSATAQTSPNPTVLLQPSDTAGHYKLQIEVSEPGEHKLNVSLQGDTLPFSLYFQEK